MIKAFTLVLVLFQIHLFGQENLKDTCKLVEVTISNDGTLNWTTQNEKSSKVFEIHQFRWNRWVKVGEIDGHGAPSITRYQFKIIPHSGENQIRVMLVNESYLSRIVKFNSLVPKIKYTIDKKTEEIKFTYDTMYEIIDTEGSLLKRGFGPSVSYKNMPEGKYILNWDNSNTNIKL